MDPLTKSLMILVAGLIAGVGVCWAVMTMGQLRKQLDELTADLNQERAERRQAEKDHGQQLAERDQAVAKAVAESDVLRRTAWPGNLTLDQRAWAVNIANLVELSTQDQLDALMRLSPDAVQRVFAKIAPHLVTKETNK